MYRLFQVSCFFKDQNVYAFSHGYLFPVSRNLESWIRNSSKKKKKFLFWKGASLITQLVKNPLAMQETPVWFLGWENPLESGWTTHSGILGLPLWLSWSRIRLQCRRPGFDPWVGKISWRKERLPTPVFWPRKFHGQSMGLQRAGHDWATFTFSKQCLGIDWAWRGLFHLGSREALPVTVCLLYSQNNLCTHSLYVGLVLEVNPWKLPNRHW